MPQTVFVWAEDEDRSGAETGLAALADDQAVTSGDTITIPEIYPFIAGYLAGTEFPDYPIIDARLAAPAIGGHGVNNLRIHKAYAGAEGLLDTAKIGSKNPGNVYDFFDNPIKPGRTEAGLAGETVTAYSVETDETGVAHFNSISLFVTNTRLPYQPHRITHIAKFTMAAIATALTWEAKALVLDDTLPTGRYTIWGADIVSATAIGARLISTNLNWRPGFIPRRNQVEAMHPLNLCLHPGGIPFRYMGGSPTVKVEYCAETTDTALSGALFLEYHG